MIHPIGIWLQQIDSNKPCALRWAIDRPSLSLSQQAEPAGPAPGKRPIRPHGARCGGCEGNNAVGGSVALSEDLQVMGLTQFKWAMRALRV